MPPKRTYADCHPVFDLPDILTVIMEWLVCCDCKAYDEHEFDKGGECRKVTTKRREAAMHNPFSLRLVNRAWKAVCMPLLHKLDLAFNIPLGRTTVTSIRARLGKVECAFPRAHAIRVCAKPFMTVMQRKLAYQVLCAFIRRLGARISCSRLMFTEGWVPSVLVPPAICSNVIIAADIENIFLVPDDRPLTPGPVMIGNWKGITRWTDGGSASFCDAPTRATELHFTLDNATFPNFGRGPDVGFKWFTLLNRIVFWTSDVSRFTLGFVCACRDEKQYVEMVLYYDSVSDAYAARLGAWNVISRGASSARMARALRTGRLSLHADPLL